MTKEDLAGASVDRLIQHKNARVLGTVLDLDAKEAPTFYEQLRRYVDSKEKTRRGMGRPASGAKPVKQVEYWPLIKVVRIYVRAAALQTGAVIVDLPGVHDSNQGKFLILWSPQGFKRATRFSQSINSEVHCKMCFALIA